MIGHSHLQALMAASRSETSAAKRDQSKKFSFVSIDPKSKWQSPLVQKDDASINSAMGHTLNQLGAFDQNSDRVLVAVLGGNIHNAIGLIQQQIPYDIIVPSRPDLRVEGNVRVLPIEQFLNHFRQHYFPYIRFFTLLAEMTDSKKLYWVEPPPPIESSDHISQNMDQWFKANYEAANLVPARAALRYKLWLLNRMVLEEAAQKGRWKLITAPSSGLDANGFLARKAWAGDATHGSAWYGEEVLKKIVAEIAEAPPE
ncbi:hypothetical protein [Allorhizobium borbori]|uniref:Uncharacterized protein n=1 Tax=Allorhizobium borbori TaxID=485907 RepID=A0A7W6K698_9HYPH|nr:hypothetical protein [Allorhizobium borbori]MBB4105975.1 hypothetical protein [Allorhizobium borbori]